MGHRGRRSAASLASPKVQTLIMRPAPPDGLTDEQAVEWRAIVDRMPADWFTGETHALLAQFCRHISAARDIAQRLQDKRLGIKDLNLLLSMQDRERKAIESLATKMRLTQQSRFHRTKSTGPAGHAGLISSTRPWEG